MGPVTPATTGSAQAPRAGLEGAGSEREPSSSDAQAGAGGRTDFSSIPFPLRNAGQSLASRRGSATSRHSAAAFNLKRRAEQTLSQQEEGAPAAASAQTLLSPPLRPRPPMGHMSWPHSCGDHTATAPPSAAPAVPSCCRILLETLGIRNKRARLAGDRAVLPGDPAGVRLGWTGTCPLRHLSAECHLCSPVQPRDKHGEPVPQNGGLQQGQVPLAASSAANTLQRRGCCRQLDGSFLPQPGAGVPHRDTSPGGGFLHPGQLQGGTLPCTLRAAVALGSFTAERLIFSPLG